MKNRILTIFLVVSVAFTGFGQVKNGDFKRLNIRERVHSGALDLLEQHPDSNNQWKYQNMADPEVSLDGVNLRTLRRYYRTFFDSIFVYGTDTIIIPAPDTFYNNYTNTWLYSGSAILFPPADSFYVQWMNEWLTNNEEIKRQLLVSPVSAYAMTIDTSAYLSDSAAFAGSEYIGFFDSTDYDSGLDTVIWTPYKVLYKNAAGQYVWKGGFQLEDGSTLIGDSASANGKTNILVIGADATATANNQIIIGDSTFTNLWTRANIDANGYLINGDSLWLNHLKYTRLPADSGKFAFNGGDSVYWAAIDIPELRVDTIFSSSSDTVFMNVLKVDSVFSFYSQIDTIYNYNFHTDSIFSYTSDTVFMNILEVDTIYSEVSRLDTVWSYHWFTDSIFSHTTDTVYMQNVSIDSVFVNYIDIDHHDSIFFQNEARWLANRDSFQFTDLWTLGSNYIARTENVLVGLPGSPGSLVIYGEQGNVQSDGDAMQVTRDSLTSDPMIYLIENTSSSPNPLLKIKSKNTGSFILCVDDPATTVFEVYNAGNFISAGLTYPASDGTAGQYLKTNGAGLLSWGTDAGSKWSVNGHGDTYLTDTTSNVAIGTDRSVYYDLFVDGNARFEDGVVTKNFGNGAALSALATDAADYAVTIAGYGGDVVRNGLYATADTCISLSSNDLGIYSLSTGVTFEGSTNSTTVPCAIFDGGTGIEADSIQLSSGVKIGALNSMATKIFWTGTQAAYDAITPKDSNTIYFIEQ